MKFRHFCLMIIAMTCILYAQGQNQQIYQIKALKEIESRGVTEEQLKERLSSRGIDYDELSKMSFEELSLLQNEIEGVVKELEIENKQKQSQKNVPSAIDDNSVNSLKIASTKSLNDTVPIKIADPLMDTMKNKISEHTSDKRKAVWGHHIFNKQDVHKFNLTNHGKPPGTYVLGEGDKLTISIWGSSQLNEVYEINKEGYINPQRMPRIFLKGVTLEKAKVITLNTFKRFYQFNINQFDLSLNEGRTININIVGEVANTGSFTIAASQTALDAIISAGGVSEIGSVRKIKIVSSGKEKILDIYKFIQNPILEKDFFMQNNDFIVVPVAERIVTIEGAVNRASRYELLDGEDLNKLLFYAGGLTEEAITGVMQLERIENDRRIILDIPYKELLKGKGDFKLKRGDFIKVFKINSEVEDYVYSKGEVRAPSSYRFYSGMTLGDLIKKIEFTSKSNLQDAFILRKNPDQTTNLIRVNLIEVRKGSESANIVLKSQDELVVYKLSDFIDRSYISVSGAARQPGKFTVDANEQLKLKDLVLLAGGLRSDAWKFAYLFRKKSTNDKDLEVIRINLGNKNADLNEDQNIAIQPFDSLLILSENDFSNATYVEVNGAINAPGRYHFAEGMTVNDLISLANGFSFSALSTNIDIFRVEILDNKPTKTIVKSYNSQKNLKEALDSGAFQLQPFDIVVVRKQPDFELQQLVSLDGEIKYPGLYALLSPNEKISDLIQRAGGLGLESFPEGATLYREQDDIGYIVLNLKHALSSVNSRYNLILKDKDVLYIPKKKDLVRISGATNASNLYPDKLLASNNSITVAFHSGRRAKFYLNHYAAGINENGDIKKVTVEHANGRIEKTRNYWFFKKSPKVYKGSIIHVGLKDPKTQKVKMDKKQVDWSKVVVDTFAQITAVLSIVLLIQNLK
ncbi:MAG: SLBB domain-containing protein [Saprospiraceae bacterium]|nr:SLBB domain-containing protein [Candidatus Vicinibacter proximus]MBL7823459.1 SLBB domain-containing protein [Saprospiraceae bacterium]MCC6842490.1 SLBB domain-containing protein [Saprospiraceae bacterium]HRG32198.1 SLBB domain-containing protein [Saprospiraceae bacterium]